MLPVVFYLNMVISFLAVGCGDHTLEEISLLPDPCPLPNAEKKRSLNERERLMYAPLSGVGGVVYDKVAISTKTFYFYSILLFIYSTPEKLIINIQLIFFKLAPGIKILFTRIRIFGTDRVAMYVVLFQHAK